MAISDEERAHLRNLFVEYQVSRDVGIRDEIVEGHYRLARHLARRFENRGVALDDLEQVAALGLLKAVERFEPDRGIEFSTFATPTILGELKRHFRDKGWAVRVPRRVQELHMRVNSVVNELTNRLGRSPSIAEIAQAARASEDEILEAMEASQAYRSAPLERSSPDGDGGTYEGAHLAYDDAGPFHVENQMLVEELLETLPPREQLMVRLRFYEEMTQSEIADRLDISQMHVSRLLSRCLELLRVRLAEADVVGPE